VPRAVAPHEDRLGLARQVVPPGRAPRPGRQAHAHGGRGHGRPARVPRHGDAGLERGLRQARGAARALERGPHEPDAVGDLALERPGVDADVVDRVVVDAGRRDGLDAPGGGRAGLDRGRVRGRGRTRLVQAGGQADRAHLQRAARERARGRAGEGDGGDGDEDEGKEQERAEQAWASTPGAAGPGLNPGGLAGSWGSAGTWRSSCPEGGRPFVPWPPAPPRRFRPRAAATWDSPAKQALAKVYADTKPTSLVCSWTIRSPRWPTPRGGVSSPSWRRGRRRSASSPRPCP